MEMKKLGFGMMRLPLTNPDDNTRIDYDHVCKMADAFMEAGFNYFDVAAPYHGKSCEAAFGACVAKRYPRESYILADKLSFSMVESAEDLPGYFESQLEKCGVDYIDYYLLHSVKESFYEKAQKINAFDFVAQKKAEGKIKKVGFSFHDTAVVLDKILTEHPEMEFVQLQINYLDWENTAIESKKCYEVCLKHKKPIIVMEPVKGGLLVNVPEEAKALFQGANPDLSVASWAVRFTASLDNVFMVLSGMSNLDQMNDNLSYMKDFKPLTGTENEVVAKATAIIKAKNAVDCTACRYCVDGCPQHIAIPTYFQLYNESLSFGESYLPTAKGDYQYYANDHGKASDCIKCGKCEDICPQHLSIIKALEDVASTLES